MDEKGGVRSEKVNEPQVVADELGLTVTQVLNDLTRGDYDITISVGPAYATLRQEAAEAMGQMVQAYPPLMQIAGDLIMKAQDGPGADEIAKRMAKMLPPELRDKEEGEEGPPPIPPEMQQAMQQATQAIEVYQQEIGQLQQALQSKDAEMQRQEDIEAAKIASQERIAKEKIRSQAEIDLLGIKKDLIIAREKARSAQETAVMTAAMKPAPAMEGGETEYDDNKREGINIEGVAIEEMPIEPPPPPPPPQPTPTDMALMAVADAMQMVARSLAAPKRPVRDADGRIIQVISEVA
jgi:hypothetical protein